MKQNDTPREEDRPVGVQVSEGMLHGNLSYIREKLHAGLRRITGTLYEDLWHDISSFLMFKVP